MFSIKTTSTDVTVTVTDKERIAELTGEGTTKSKYLIFTDSGTFENTDTMLFWKFNSSDIYGSIKVNQTYTFTVVGWRIPFFSSYQNIVKVKEIPNNSLDIEKQ